jgi:hypothetical protein
MKAKWMWFSSRAQLSHGWGNIPGISIFDRLFTCCFACYILSISFMNWHDFVNLSEADHVNHIDIDEISRENVQKYWMLLENLFCQILKIWLSRLEFADKNYFKSLCWCNLMSFSRIMISNMNLKINLWAMLNYWKKQQIGYNFIPHAYKSQPPITSCSREISVRQSRNKQNDWLM